MYTFKKILVGLDQSEMDLQLIDAACKICQISRSSDIYFINVIKDFEVPESVLQEFPDILDKALEERKGEIKKLVDDKFQCEAVNVHYIIKQGQATKEFMKLINEEKMDLIVLGRKNEMKGGGILINRLARRATCSMMAIPKNSNISVSNMLVPIDFSSYAKMAFEKAVEFANKEPGSKIVAQNVYQVPNGYRYTGKTFDEFSEIMRENAKNSYKVFTKDIKSNDLNVDTIYTLDKDDDVISQIYQNAKDQNATMILMGAKGRSATTAIFIGSKAEKMIQLDSDIPIIIIRPKGKGAGILEYIKEI
ncbi:MAG: universal stress protein [Cyclobacteriaceae bacterium]